MPRWQASTPRRSGGEDAHNQEGGNRSPEAHPAILLNQLSPEKQVIFLEKFSLLNPIQQAFAYNQFFSIGPDIQNFAISQFIELDSDLLIRSIQTELERVAKAFPKELEIVLAGARPELKFNPDLVVKLPIGRVCNDHQWVDGRGVSTLYRDCDSGFVYNINTNVHFNTDDSTTRRPDVEDPVTSEEPSTVRPTGIPPLDPPDDGSGDGDRPGDGSDETTTKIPETTTFGPKDPSTGIPPIDPPDDDNTCEQPRSTTESGDCPGPSEDWFLCDSGDTCVPKCRW